MIELSKSDEVINGLPLKKLHQLLTEANEDEEPVKIIFMGAGDHSVRDCDRLHQKLTEATEWLSGIQQLGLQGEEYSKEEYDRGERAIEEIISEIALKLTGKRIKFADMV